MYSEKEGCQVHVCVCARIRLSINPCIKPAKLNHKESSSCPRALRNE